MLNKINKIMDMVVIFGLILLMTALGMTVIISIVIALTGLSFNIALAIIWVVSVIAGSLTVYSQLKFEKEES